MAEEIKVGDIVWLKSGGPQMTVDEIGHYEFTGGGPLSAKCSWFDSKNERKKDVFPLTSLTKERPSKT